MVIASSRKIAIENISQKTVLKEANVKTREAATNYTQKTADIREYLASGAGVNTSMMKSQQTSQKLKIRFILWRLS